MTDNPRELVERVVREHRASDRFETMTQANPREWSPECEACSAVSLNTTPHPCLPYRLVALANLTARNWDD